MTWIISADSATCSIYQYDEKPPQLVLIKQITHPENRLKNSEYLTSDKPGHYQGANSAHGAYSPHSDPKEVEIDKFAREMANELNKGRVNHAYQKLIIVAAPEMYGLLNQHLDKHVKELIGEVIQKDMLHLKEHEFLDFLKTNLQKK